MCLARQFYGPPVKNSHHTTRRAYSSASYSVPLPPGHAFPMSKYEAVRQQLLLDGTLDETIVPPRADWQAVEQIHQEQYLKKLRFGELSPREERLLGLPWSSGLVERALRAAGGTLAAARDALGPAQAGLGMNLAGGTHHAYPDHGEGFCVFNDVAIAATVLLGERAVARIVVLDLDVHQGNGTAAIFRHDRRVFTISVHGQRNYPWRKEQSDLDLGLADSISDGEYLALLLENILPSALQQRPDLVFYIAGVDVMANDRFGRFALSLAGTMQRDRLVFAWAKHHRIPIVSLMGGGYNRQPGQTALAHSNTVRAAVEIYG
jgi:acetoin utilization deacetylase AcuC-like enzyme